MTARLVLIATVIAVGLSIRIFGPQVGLPAFFIKYGGSVLWATMIYFIVDLLLPGQECRTIACLAFAITACVELFRLCHTPWLDAFRLTMPGALLIGRIFSLWNIVAYVGGIALGAMIVRSSRRPALP